MIEAIKWIVGISAASLAGLGFVILVVEASHRHEVSRCIPYCKAQGAQGFVVDRECRCVNRTECTEWIVASEQSGEGDDR